MENYIYGVKGLVQGVKMTLLLFFVIPLLVGYFIGDWSANVFFAPYLIGTLGFIFSVFTGLNYLTYRRYKNKGQF